MPHNYTRTDQVKFLTEWFDSWSEMQREDFLPIMIQALNPGDHVNGLVGGICTLGVGGRRPSLFDCQVKLFQDWYENWTPEERERLLQHFTTTDPDFASKLHKSYASQQTEEIELTSSPIPDPVDEDKDDGVSPGSHSSSPLSSLSQPLSPHDSGLEENHLELDATPESLRGDDSNPGPAEGSCAITDELKKEVELPCQKEEEAVDECAIEDDAEAVTVAACVVEREV